MYSDVPQSHWAYNNILWASRLKLIQGYPDGTFLPDQAVTRAEAATIALRTLGVSVLATSAGLVVYSLLTLPKTKKTRQG